MVGMSLFFFLVLPGTERLEELVSAVMQRAGTSEGQTQPRVLVSL